MSYSSYSEEVRECLEELHPELYEPPYKFSGPQTEMLENLRDLYTDIEVDPDIVLEILEALKFMYKIQAENSAKKLEMVNIKWENLPVSEQRLLQEIAECQEGLELQEFNEASLERCKSDKVYKRLEYKRDASSRMLEGKILDRINKRFQEMCDQLNDTMLRWKEEIPAECESDKSLLDEYKKHMQILQDNINRLEIENTEQPKYVVDLIEDINSLKDQIHQTEKEFAEHKDLPPIVVEVQRLVRECQIGLPNLREKIERRMPSN